MLDKNKLAEAARNNDAVAEEHGVKDYCERNNIDIDGLAHVAEQRAMRALAIFVDHRSPEMFQTNKRFPLPLSATARKLLPMVSSIAMDGICIGIMAERNDKPLNLDDNEVFPEDD